MDIPRRSKLSHQSKSFTRTRHTRLLLICGVSIVLICIVVFGIVKSINANVFHIDTVQIFGADEDTVSSLHTIADQTLDGSYMGLFSHRSSLIYPHDSLVAAIISTSTRILQVTIRRDGWHSLIISVNNKVPVAIACTTLPDWDGDTLNTDSDSCYLTDHTGYMFKKSASMSGQIYNRYYVPDVLDLSTSTDIDGLGYMATSTTEFMSLQNLYESIKSAEMDPQALLIKAGGEYELYIHQKGPSTGTTSTNNMAVIYFNNARPFDVQLSNLLSFWGRMSSDSAIKKVHARFEYLDIRYGSNVFYRLIK